MRKTNIFLMIILITTSYFLHNNIKSMKVAEGAIDDEIYFIFSMGDIEVFNSFRRGKDLDIKVGLAYGSETHDVEIGNISKDNRLSFILDLGSNFQI